MVRGSKTGTRSLERAILENVHERLRVFRDRYLTVTADTTTSGVLNRASWAGLIAGVLFGLISLTTQSPADAALQGTSFAVLMVLVYQFAFLLTRARRRRERDDNRT